MGEESLVIIPFNTDKSDMLENALGRYENIVVMKAFKHVRDITDMVVSKGYDQSCITVMSNIGMEDQYVGPVADRDYGYFTTLLIKTEGKK